MHLKNAIYQVYALGPYPAIKCYFWPSKGESVGTPAPAIGLVCLSLSNRQHILQLILHVGFSPHTDRADSVDQGHG